MYYSNLTLRVATKSVAALILSVGLTGCLSSIHKQGVALNAATAPVLANTAVVFQTAQAAHNLSQDYDAIAEFDSAASVYDPRNVTPLLSDRDIAARKSVLDAFQLYVQNVVDITSGTDSPALDSASKSVGSNTVSLASGLAPMQTITGSYGPEISAGMGTAANALGQFLVSKKIKQELPKAIVRLDPVIQSLCATFESELAGLKEQEHKDFEDIIHKQTLALRTDASKTDMIARQDKIMALPGLVRTERLDAAQIDQLVADLRKLALANHALAAVAQNNNPESLKQKINEISDVATSLSNFYTSATN